MPSLSFFADADDAPRLMEHLNEDPEIAFLVPLDPIASIRGARLPGDPDPPAVE